MAPNAAVGANATAGTRLGTTSPSRRPGLIRAERNHCVASYSTIPSESLATQWFRIGCTINILAQTRYMHSLDSYYVNILTILTFLRVLLFEYRCYKSKHFVITLCSYVNLICCCSDGFLVMEVLYGSTMHLLVHQAYPPADPATNTMRLWGEVLEEYVRRRTSVRFGQLKYSMFNPAGGPFF